MDRCKKHWILAASRESNFNLHMNNFFVNYLLGAPSGLQRFSIIPGHTRTIFEVIGAFVGLEDVDELADQLSEAADGPLADPSEHGLEAREGLFDWIEVGAAGRQEAQGSARRFDRFAHRCALVARQIVHDDGIAAPQLASVDAESLDSC
jgi:hypothetical protein